MKIITLALTAVALLATSVAHTATTGMNDPREEHFWPRDRKKAFNIPAQNKQLAMIPYDFKYLRAMGTIKAVIQGQVRTCNAQAISPYYVITSAYCVMDGKTPGKNIRFTEGFSKKVNRDVPGRTFKAIEVYVSQDLYRMLPISHDPKLIQAAHDYAVVRVDSYMGINNFTLRVSDFSREMFRGPVAARLQGKRPERDIYSRDCVFQRRTKRNVSYEWFRAQDCALKNHADEGFRGSGLYQIDLKTRNVYIRGIISGFNDTETFASLLRSKDIYAIRDLLFYREKANIKYTLMKFVVGDSQPVRQQPAPKPVRQQPRRDNNGGGLYQNAKGPELYFVSKCNADVYVAVRYKTRPNPYTDPNGKWIATGYYKVPRGGKVRVGHVWAPTLYYYANGKRGNTRYEWKGSSRHYVGGRVNKTLPMKQKTFKSSLRQLNIDLICR